MSSPTDNPGRGHILVVTAIVTVSFAAVVVVLRCVARSRITKSLGFDDWLLMLSLVCAIIATGTEVASVHHGLGHHARDLTAAQKTAASRLSAIGQAFCIMSLSFCKFTIVMTFLRAIDGTGKRLAGIFLWFNGIAAFVVNTVTVGIMLGTCTPVEKNYNPKIHGTCFSPQVFARVVLAQGIVSAATDFLLSLFPIAILRKLQMPLRTKVLLISLMSLGCVAGVFAAVRTAYTGPYTKQGDPTWTTINLVTWATVERNMAIVLISVPILPKFVAPIKSMTTSLLSSRSRKKAQARRLASHTSSNNNEYNAESSERLPSATAHGVAHKHPAEIQLEEFI